MLRSFSSRFQQLHHHFPTQRHNIFHTANAAKASFHKRPLPNTLIALSSPHGKKLFIEALHSGYMESFFALSEQFVTQSEPSFCALSSLAMVLNALNFDPKKVWKGSWRWVSEETLQCESKQMCGHSLEKVRSDGMDFNEFESLAVCHGVKIKSCRVVQNEDNFENLNTFRDYVKEISASDKADCFIITNFSRKVLGQTGSGHFSPVGGYHSGLDLVLILDVARFKYPPFWVPVETMWRSMVVEDEASGNSRGYFIVSTGDTLDLTLQAKSDNADYELKKVQHSHSHDCVHHTTRQ